MSLLLLDPATGDSWPISRETVKPLLAAVAPTRLPVFSLQMTRQDNLCIWQRPGDLWAGQSCYGMVRDLLTPLHKGETIEPRFIVPEITRLGIRKVTVRFEPVTT